MNSSDRVKLEGCYDASIALARYEDEQESGSFCSRIPIFLSLEGLGLTSISSEVNAMTAHQVVIKAHMHQKL